MAATTTIVTSRPTPPMNEDRLWRAVLERDRTQDGRFFFGVKTTGVYCRPSCPARRPKRENVLFWRSLAEAERAGFRPCKRCRPREIDAQQAFVQRACAYIDAHADQPVTLAELGEAVGVSPHHLHRTFKRVVGITPREYLESRRLSAVKTRLREGRDVTSALYDAGYGSSSRLYERADDHLGMTPNTYRRGGEGMEMMYTIADSPLGRLLVAATERGVSAVRFGESDQELEATLEREFPAAKIVRNGASDNAWVQAVIDQVSGEQPRHEVPVDVRATAFQRRVWEALRAIPAGTTRSYGEVARAIGEPTAARAVAQACASNPVAVVVPCHRVVRGNGDLGGYRWGVERKRALLEQERTGTEG